MTSYQLEYNLAQLLEHCIGIAEVRVHIPHEFFKPAFSEVALRNYEEHAHLLQSAALLHKTCAFHHVMIYTLMTLSVE